MMAQAMDLLSVNDTAMASAEPKPTPYLMMV